MSPRGHHGVASGNGLQSTLSRSSSQTAGIGLDEANAGDLIPGDEVETEAAAWRGLTRRRMEIGFHLELNDLLTQLDQWITDRAR